MRPYQRFLACFVLVIIAEPAFGQATTEGFLNLPRAEVPGTLISHPDDNDSRGAGRTTNLMIHGGWLMTGSEAPGSQPGADMEFRVYDISNPANPVRRRPSDFGLVYDGDQWYRGNWGYHTHGHYQTRLTLQPGPVYVNEFGGSVFRGNPSPQESQAWDGSGFDRGRGARQTPWGASDDWAYGDDAEVHFVTKLIFESTVGDWSTGNTRNVAIASYPGGRDGVRGFPIVFGDRLILLSDQRNSGLATYRIPFGRLEAPDSTDPLPQPELLGVLNEPLGGYWPELYANAGRLYAVFTRTNRVQVAEITDPTSPVVVRDFFLDGARNATYPKFQDNLLMIHDWVVNMDRLISGHVDPIELTLDLASVEETPRYPGRLDTSQFSLPVGNLIVTGGYGGGSGEGGMAIWVRQQAPDTTPPEVAFHVPEAGRTGYPRYAPLSFIIHETLDHLRLDPSLHFLVRPVLANGDLGSPVEGLLVFGSGNVLTFTPHLPLEEDRTYQVDFPSDPASGVGMRDVAGNYIQGYSYRFSTSDSGEVDPAPVIEAFTVSENRIEPGNVVEFTVAATDGVDVLRYRLNPGDGSGFGAWQDEGTFSWTYPETGRYTASVQVRDVAGNQVTATERLLVLNPVGGSAPTQSSSIIRASDGRIWVVNPDANSVTVLDGVSGGFLAEYPVGADPRTLAEDALGRIWVACHDADRLYLLNPEPVDPATVVQEVIELGYGDAPFGLCPSPDGRRMYLSLYGRGGVLSIDTETFSTDYVELGPTPRAVAVNAEGDKVYVTRFISGYAQAEVWRVSSTGGNLGSVRTIGLQYGFTNDRGDRGAGIPNYLSGIAISPNGQFAVVSSKQDNVFRGKAFGTPDLTHESTVRAILITIDLIAEQEVGNSYTSRRDIDNSDSPSALRFTPDGDALAVAVQGNAQVVLLDALDLATEVIEITSVPMRAGVGLAPQGLVFHPETGQMYVQNFMSRTVSRMDAAELLDDARFNLLGIGETRTVQNELLAPDVLRGKQVFYHAADERMSAESYISCASCHLDGGTDGRIWDFTGRGEGLRRTPSLRGRGGMAHGNVHWSGNFDEIQDFEHDIRGPFGGTGFIDDPNFNSNHSGPGSIKAGLSADLDALAAYVSSLGLKSLPRSPFRNAGGGLTTEAVAGQILFEEMDCRSCHSGPGLTNSVVTPVFSPVLTDVGTVSGESGRRLGGPDLSGVDVPTLLALYENIRYLHHGQGRGLAESLEFVGGPVFEAEDAVLVYGANPDAVRVVRKDGSVGGGGGWSIHGISGGALVQARPDDPAAETGVRFEGIDGASGGAGHLMVKATYGFWSSADFVIRVNGVDQRAPSLRTEIGSGTTNPRWQRFEVVFQPGPVNTIEVLRPADTAGNTLMIDAIMVANAERIGEAAPHRVVSTLSGVEKAQLEAFLLSLDGSTDPQPTVHPGLSGTLTREYWTGVSGGIAGLLADPDYPLHPDGVDTLERLEAVHWTDPIETSNFADNYGQRIRGYIVPLFSGAYTFWIASDDESRLLLSTDANPVNAVQIAEVDGWTGKYDYGVEPSQESAPIFLQAGMPYYIEVLHVEGGGGDHLSVAWSLDIGTDPTEDDIPAGVVLSALDAGVPMPFTNPDEDWLREHFGISALVNPTPVWMSDGDGDQILTVFEFLHGLHPGRVDRLRPTRLVPDSANGGMWFEFELTSDTGRIPVAVETSVDLIRWDPVPRSEWVLVGSHGDLDIWGIRMDPDAQHFVRLRAVP